MVYEDEINLLEDETEIDDLGLEDLEEATDLADADIPPRPDPEEMLPLLRSEIPSQRMLAARAFCELQDARAIPDLIALLKDACPLVRVSAAYGLGRNPSTDAVEPLIAQLHQDWNGYVRKGIVWALGNCHDRRALPSLIQSLKLDISAVRLWAASSLAQAAELGYEAAIATIPSIVSSIVSDPVAAVRSNCAWSLGRLCRELPSNVVYATAVDALIQVVEEDRDLSVRADAKAALLKLGDPRGIQAIENLDIESLEDL
jgi:HEAT repeat protein